MPRTQPRPTTLSGLLQALRQGQIGDRDYDEWTSLPTYGGHEPPTTYGVWSWDDTSLLVGERLSEFEIVPRVIESDEDRVHDAQIVRARRYHVQPVADEQCASTTGELLDTSDDLEEARRIASRAALPYGAAIIDTVSGLVDYGAGFAAVNLGECGAIIDGPGYSYHLPGFQDGKGMDAHAWEPVDTGAHALERTD